MRAGWSGTVAVTLAALAVATAGASHFTEGFRAWTSDGARRVRVADDPPQLPALRALSTSGDEVSPWRPGAVDAPVHLVAFMYTRCPSLCRVAGEEFEVLQRALRNGPDVGVRLLSISFDPAFDTPARLRDYAKRHRVDQTYWKLLAPRDDDTMSSLLRIVGVVVIDDGLGGFTHNAAIHVVARDGRLVRIFDIADYQRALDFARDLASP